MLLTPSPRMLLMRLWVGHLVCMGLLGCDRPSPIRTSNVAEAFAEFQRVSGGQKDTASSCRVFGRVLDARHREALAHAVVFAEVPRTWGTPRPNANEKERLTITDDDGRWMLELTQDTGYELTVSAVGYVPESQRLRNCSFQPVDVLLRHGGAAVFGSVRAIDGTPIAGATISARSVAPEAEIGRVVALGLSDKHGHYTLPCGTGDYVVEARYPRAVTTGARIELSTVGFADFRMVPSNTISGHVRSRSTGRRTPGAVVLGTADAAGAPAAATSISTVSDATGAFTLTGLWPGPVALTAHTDGLTSYESTALAVGVHEEKQGVELWLDRGYAVSGTVVRDDAASTPVQDLWLTAVDAESDRAWPASGPSDANGRFAIPGLPPGRYSLQVASSDEPTAAIARPIEIAGADISDEVVTLPPATALADRAQPELAGPTVSLRGKVVDTRLQPTAHVWLEVSSGAPPKATHTVAGSIALRSLDSVVHRVQTSDSGDFEIARLSPGDYRFALYDQYGRRPWAKSPEPNDAGAALVLPVRAAQNPVLQLKTEVCAATIRGRALNVHGASVPDAWVYAEREGDDEADLAESASSRLPTVVTSASGAFELVDICPGSYRVRVTSSDHEAGASTGGVRANARLALTLVGTSTVSGVVSYDDAPVTDYVLTVAGPRTERITVRAADGKYRLARLDPGMYEALVSSGQGYGQGMIEVTPASAVEYNFVLRPWNSLQASLVDGSGQPLAGVDVQAVFEPPGGEAGDLLGPSVRIRRAVTDARGQFKIDQVTDGRGYLALARAGRELLIENVPYASQFGPLIGPNPRLRIQVKQGAPQDLGVIRVRVP